MRIISGYLKGKKINIPIDNNTRPLRDMVKESIFNIINHSSKIFCKIENADILALLPGSLATPLTTMIPSYISGTSCVNNAAKKSLDDLDKNI